MTSLRSEMEQFFLWMGEEKKAPCGNGKIAQNMSKRPLFPSAARFESEPGLKFRKAFNWAAVGFKHAPKHWVLSEY